MTGIDWDVELQKIEREYDGLPPQPSADQLRVKRLAEQRKKEQESARAAAIGGWARLLLVAGLAAAIPWWPYAHDCGMPLAGYLGAVAAVFVGAVWVAGCTWQRRLPVAHTLAITLFVAALAYGAFETLPRMGYVRIGAGPAPAWRCTLR